MHLGEVPAEARREHWIPGTKVLDSGEPPNVGTGSQTQVLSLQEQCVLLTRGPSSQPLFIITVVTACVNVSVCVLQDMWRSQDSFTEPVLSFCLYRGSRDQTQVFRLLPSRCIANETISLALGQILKFIRK